MEPAWSSMADRVTPLHVQGGRSIGVRPFLPLDGFTLFDARPVMAASIVLGFV
jgi:hypothetical protein